MKIIFLLRLEKLNNVVRRSQPLKAWTARNTGEVKARLEVELTARRTLSFLSGDINLTLLMINTSTLKEKCKSYKKFLALVVGLFKDKAGNLPQLFLWGKGVEQLTKV